MSPEPHLEVWIGGVRSSVALTGPRVTVGREPGCDLVLSAERSVSRVHAVFEQVGPGWCVRDLGSRNGTLVNGARAMGERILRTGDEVQVGSVKILFHGDGEVEETAFEASGHIPLTRRERDVLVALCRPVLSGELFPEPASVRQMAAELFVSEAAVKQHLSNLYDKFGVFEGGDSRRRLLATEVLQRGVVTLADLRPTTLPGG